MCHARVMPDGTLLKGAQGNFPADRIVADNLRQQAAATQDPAALLDGVRLGQRTFFSMPWLTPDPIARGRVDVDRRDRAASTTRCRSAPRRA